MKYTWKELAVDMHGTYVFEQCKEEKDVFRLRQFGRGKSFYGTIGDVIRWLETEPVFKKAFDDEAFMTTAYKMEEGPTP